MHVSHLHQARLQPFPPGLAVFAILVLAATPGADAAITLAEGAGELNVTTSVSATYDSNIFATSAATSDTLLAGQIRIGYERNARNSFHAGAEWNFGRFNKRSDQDYSDPKIDAGLATKVGAFATAFDLSTVRTHSADSLVGTRTDRRDDRAGLSLRGPVWGIYALDGSMAYHTTTYRTAGLRDLESWSAAVDVSRPLTPKLNGFIGLATNLDDVTDGSRSRDWSYSVGLNQEILPKVTGTVRAGWQTRRNATEAVDFSGFTTSVDLNWRATPRLRVAAQAARAASTVASGQSVVQEDWNLNATLSLPARWSAGVAAGQTRSRFLDAGNRHDRTDQLTASLSHPLGDLLDASLGTSWSHNVSDRSDADYHRQTVTLTLSLAL